VQQSPRLEIPTRALSNVRFDPKKAIIEMGPAKQTRQFFDLSMARKFMQTTLIAAQCKQLIDAGKTASIRQLYYLSKHDVAGTREKTFNDQVESDPIIEDLEVTLDALREELHVFADQRGNLAGPITLVDSGDVLDCMRMGSGGYTVPSIVEPEVVQFKKCSAKFILHVEKATIWRRFHEDGFHDKHQCILTTGKASPPGACGGCCGGCTKSSNCLSSVFSTMIRGGTTSTRSSSRVRSAWPTKAAAWLSPRPSSSACPASTMSAAG
jgi:DNA topoisomerase-6 subunit A